MGKTMMGPSRKFTKANPKFLNQPLRVWRKALTGNLRSSKNAKPKTTGMMKSFSVSNLSLHFSPGLSIFPMLVEIMALR